MSENVSQENLDTLKKYVDWMKSNGIQRMKIADIEIDLVVQNTYWPWYTPQVTAGASIPLGPTYTTVVGGDQYLGDPTGPSKL